MGDAFVDTSGWFEFLVRGGATSRRAILLMDEWLARERRIVTTNYVLAELVPLLLIRRVVRPERDRIIDFIRSASWLEIVHISPEWDAAAWDLEPRRLRELRPHGAARHHRRPHRRPPLRPGRVPGAAGLIGRALPPGGSAIYDGGDPGRCPSPIDRPEDRPSCDAP